MKIIMSLKSALALSIILLAGCAQGEGDRCNPQLLPFHDECGDNQQGPLRCTVPPGCVIAACCPPPERITAASDPACRACLPDGGGDGGAGD